MTMNNYPDFLNSPELHSIVNRHKNEVPVKIVALANDLGIDVYKTKLPEDVSGFIKRDPKDNTYAIYVNRNHSLTRRRFTIAHEIAHFLLHRKILDNIGIVDRNIDAIDNCMYRSNGISDEKEVQANKLAASLLMPESTIENLIRNDKVNTVEDLAERLNVSPCAMAIRLKSLGYVTE